MRQISLILALVCFVLAALNVPTRFNAVGLGLAFFTLAALI